NAVVGPIGAADEDLATGDAPAIAQTHRARADRTRRIAAAGRLGETEEGLLLAAQGRKEIFLLLLVIGLEELCQAGAAERAVAGHIKAAAMLRHLDRQQGAGNDIDVGAT